MNQNTLIGLVCWIACLVSGLLIGFVIASLPGEIYRVAAAVAFVMTYAFGRLDQILWEVIKRERRRQCAASQSGESPKHGQDNDIRPAG